MSEAPRIKRVSVLECVANLKARAVFESEITDLDHQVCRLNLLLHKDFYDAAVRKRALVNTYLTKTANLADVSYSDIMEIAKITLDIDQCNVPSPPMEESLRKIQELMTKRTSLYEQLKKIQWRNYDVVSNTGAVLFSIRSHK